VGPRFELRHEPAPDLEAIGEDPGLVERIRAEIRRDGPMPFVRFMALALYDPDGGYYRAAEARPGWAGRDFLTAPELHPIFGATLAAGLRDAWDGLGRPTPFTIREHGAGEGALARSMLDAIADDATFSAAIRYEPVEVDARRVAALRTALDAAGHGGSVSEPEDGPFVGVVLANEVLDALPVHRVRQRGADLRELAVDVDPGDARLIEVEIEPTTPDLAARLAAEDVRLVDGQTAEICLDLEPWLARATADLRRGLVVLIDYGAPAAELYDPRRRRAGTLRAYLRHRVHDDPLIHVGRQDLTAHVDVSAVEAAGRAVGLATIGRTTQAEALLTLGIEARWRAIQADPATTPEAYAHARGAVMRLIDPGAMGRFRVVVMGRDWPPEAPLAWARGREWGVGAPPVTPRSVPAERVARPPGPAQ
jgi:SAM-dependent MidA family methyltransferase